MVFVAFVPLLRIAQRSERAVAAVVGVSAGVATYATVFSWLPQTLTHLPSLSSKSAWTLSIAGVVYHAMQLGLFAVGIAMLSRLLPAIGAHPMQRSLLAMGMVSAALWVALEWAYPVAIPWSLGDTLAPNRWLRQAADIGGVHGLAFAIIFVNAGVTFALDATLPGLARARALAGAAIVLAVLIAYGGWQLGRERRSSDDLGIRVGVVQGAISAEASRGEGAVVRAWDTYERLTNRLFAESTPIDLIVWPETTLEVDLRADDWYRDRLERLAAQRDRAIVVGALDRSGEPPAEFNSTYAFTSPSGRYAGAMRPPQIYHKMFLLPWAEYLPGGDWLPILHRWRTTGEFKAGSQQTIFVFDRSVEGRVGPVLAAPSICSDVVKPGWFNPIVRAGATVLINLTDDSWFAGTAAPDLHFQRARMRAVETRRWLVRASNSGSSAFLDPTGDVVASLPFGVTGTLAHSVFLSDGLTLYVRFGDWIVLLSTILVVVTVVRWAARPRLDR